MYTPINALTHLSSRDSRPVPGDSGFRDDYNETRNAVQTGARVISIGAIVGIVIGALVFIGALVAVCILVRRHNRRRANNAAISNKGVFGPGGRHSDASSNMPPGYGWGAGVNGQQQQQPQQQPMQDGGVNAPPPAAGHHGLHHNNNARKDFTPGHAGMGGVDVLTELFTSCRCLYYEHAVDRCSSYGRRGHTIQRRTLFVGYWCAKHSQNHYDIDHQDSSRATSPSRLTVGSRGGQAGGHVGYSRNNPEAEPIATPEEKVADDRLLGSGAGGHEGVSSSKLQQPKRWYSPAALTLKVLNTHSVSQSLLELEKLRHLWPQVVRECGPTDAARVQILELVRRLSKDLQITFNEEGEDELVARIIELLSESDAEIAEIIWEAHRHLGESEEGAGGHGTQRLPAGLEDDYKYAEYRSVVERQIELKLLDKAPSLEGHNKDEINDLEFAKAILDKFLSESVAVKALQASMMEFLSPMQLEPEPIRTFRRFQRWAENTLDEIVRVPPEATATRVSWKCTCGRRIVDDYFINRSDTGRGPAHGVLDNDWMTKQVGDALPDSRKFQNTLTSAASPSPQTASWTISSLCQDVANLVRSATTGTARLPRHNQSGAGSDHSRLGMCPSTLSSIQQGPGEHNFVLLCVPFMRHGAKLFQPETCTINSDREFFKALRYHYRHGRGSAAWSRLRKVRSLRFVKFEVYQSELVDIQQCPSMPPNDLLSVDYLYEPAESIPPVGPNLLMHLFEHPDHAEVLPVLFRRIPKKLKSRLRACQRMGRSVGWGIQIHESLNWVALFFLGCFGFLACLVTAVAWTVARDDVQGGFAIASFMLAFLVFCGGMVHSEAV
ncbi:hypothetical protein PspLS_11300 [Pyricularia sp. CBS 133598]|nr:hypothetical protein PspLS_11300 [Pyricularia sp. CBS 133598]